MKNNPATATQSLAKALSTKQKADKLSVEALAKAIGVSVISATGVLTGKSKPNKATASRYAAFLGTDVAAISGPSAAPKTAKQAGEKKRGRPPGKKSAITSVKAAKPSKAAKPEVSAHPIFDRTLEEALNLFNDPLAVAIYGANDAKRARIARILGL